MRRKRFDMASNGNNPLLQKIDPLRHISGGMGKTHLASPLGMVPARHRFSTYYINCHTLIEQLKKAHFDRRLKPQMPEQFTRPEQTQYIGLSVICRTFMQGILCGTCFFYCWLGCRLRETRKCLSIFSVFQDIADNAFPRSYCSVPAL